MFTALIIVTLIVCVLLMLIVLAQNPKGGGLSTQFGGAGASQLMGVKRTGDLLERLTWGFAVALMVFSLTAHAMLGSNSAPAQVRSVNMEKAKQGPAPTPTAAPVAPPPAGAEMPATDGAAPATTDDGFGSGEAAKPAAAEGMAKPVDKAASPAPTAAGEKVEKMIPNSAAPAPKK